MAADPLATFHGALLRPGDSGYEEARRVHNGMIDKRPALIARCGDAGDAAAAIAYARAHELEISVRGGGHNVAGTAVTDGGVMVDLAGLRQVDVDREARNARAQGGATWGVMDSATQANGLAVTGGMISSTGVAGLTLGGGLGWLMGRYGLSCDNLRAAEVVTADSRVLRASEEENTDLFWAIRGGGGNFGAAIELEFHVHPVGPVVTAIQASFPVERAPEVLALYRELTTDGPDDLTMNAALLHTPEGEQLVGILGCHLGGQAQAKRDLAPLRRLRGAVALDLGPSEYRIVNSLLDVNYPRGALNYWKSRFLRALSDDAIAQIVASFRTAPSPRTTFVIENLHGAVTRVPVEATAVPHRQPGYNFLMTSVWDAPAASAGNVAWTRGVFEAIHPFVAEPRYSNYLDADEVADVDPVRDSYGPNYERLVEVKRAYDPDNVFRLNQNVKP